MEGEVVTEAVTKVGPLVQTLEYLVCCLIFWIAWRGMLSEDDHSEG